MEPETAVPTFECFVHRTATRYERMARAYLRDPDEAEDAVQSAFLRTWKCWDRVSASPRLDAWVAAVVRNECIDRWRRNRLARRADVRIAREEAVAASAPADGIEAREARREAEHDLELARAAIREMAEPYRSVLVLRFIERLSYEEIARCLGKPLGAVKTTICRAVRLVRVRLHPHGTEGADT